MQQITLTLYHGNFYCPITGQNILSSENCEVSLQFGHDLSAVETIRGAVQPATAFWLQFGHDLSAVETRPADWVALPTLTLQFGHDLSAVETVRE